MKKMNKRGRHILVMVLVFAILCTSLPCTPTIPVHAAQTGKNGTWYEVSARINASWGGNITGEITVTNVSSQTRQDWQIAIPWKAQINSMWNGRYEETDEGYLITPLEYNAELAPEASVSLGFTAEGDDSELSRLTEEGFFQEAGVSITDAEERETGVPVSSGDAAVIIPKILELTEESAESTVTPTEEPTVSPTKEPVVIPTVEPMVCPAFEPTVSPMEEPTASPTFEPTVSLTEEPTASPTEEPTVSPTEEPTASPAEEPIVSPTEEPTPSPMVEPTPSPTASPTAEPTEEPTASPTASPTEEPAGDFYVYTDTVLQEDLVCGNLFLMGGNLNCNGHSITVQKDYFQNGGSGNFTAIDLMIGGSFHGVSGNTFVSDSSNIHVNENIILTGGDIMNFGDSVLDIGGNLEISGVNYFTANGGKITAGGNLSCATQQYFYQSNGELTVKGDLNVSSGRLDLGGTVQAEVHGDLYTEGQGCIRMDTYLSEGTMTVHGDVVIDSASQTELMKGSLVLLGDLVQTEQAAANSLRTDGSFQLLLKGDSLQKIEAAHAEGITLGTLDLRESTVVEVPDEIHGKAVHGMDRIKGKKRLDLYLSYYIPEQDESIRCETVSFHGDTIVLSDYDLTCSGNLEISGVNYFMANGGKITAGGNLSCATQQY